MAKKELEENAVLQQKKLSQLEQLCRALSSRQAASSPTAAAATATTAATPNEDSLNSVPDQAPSSSS
ncbi:unnamed protein product [Cylicostephanus goldi]|uniref:Uncharacterized protein n=1 Tax=Cylicostephanus goldi TaxID=71465 RepID=A0A3P7R4X2_CYLGO|nr:unnamed protein product [Cylicostephanus goldi]